jgi:oligo-1,6-glucosidase
VYVYQGEELGMTNARFASIDEFRDVESRNHYAEAVGAGADPETVLASLRAASRDHARTPMQWDASKHAGFTTGTPWMPVNPNYTEINAQAALADPDSVLHHYRRLIELRHTEPTVAHGDFHMLLADHEQVYAFTRRHGDTELLVLGNFSGGSVTVDIPDAAGWLGAELVLTNIPAADAVQAQLTLAQGVPHLPTPPDGMSVSPACHPRAGAEGQARSRADNQGHCHDARWLSYLALAA